MDNMLPQLTLIGLDGGASKITGWIVRIHSTSMTFDLDQHTVTKVYSDYNGFQSDFLPVDINIQLEEMSDSQIHLTESEEIQGNIFSRACAAVIAELAALQEDQPLLAGIGFPGLKTSDKCGIAAMANGPRLPNFLDQVESLVEEAGVDLVTVIDHIGSDADYCGMGEEYATQGLFRDVDNAYYLGGGTGAADAMKLNGDLIPFDHAKSWIAKSWELKNTSGDRMERFASANGIQSVYADISGISLSDLNQKGIYADQILERAMEGDSAAGKTIKLVVKNLAKLLVERLTTIYCGWKSPFAFVNPKRESLIDQHPFKQTILDRVVIGQRLGALLSNSRKHAPEILWKPLHKEMGNIITKTGCLPAEAREKYLIHHHGADDRIALREGMIVTSNIREAPALGAAIDAYLTFMSGG